MNHSGVTRIILGALLFVVSVIAIPACSTKEDYDPSLSEKPPKYEPPVIIDPFDNLADSPSCIITENNFLTVHTYTFGDIDDMGEFFTSGFRYSTKEFFVKNLSTGTSINVSFNGLPKTGIYTTALNWSSVPTNSYETAVVRVQTPFYVFYSYPGQKIYVHVGQDIDHMTVKFCELKFDNLNPPDTVLMTCRLTNQ